MNGAVLAAVITAALVVSGGAAYLVGAESAPTDEAAKEAEDLAHRDALEEAKLSSQKSARAEARQLGRAKGASAGSTNGKEDVEAELLAEQEAADTAAAAEAAAAAQADTNGPNDPCPPGTNFVPAAGGCVGGDW